MSKATLQAVEDALQAHIRSELEDGEDAPMLMDWVVGYTTCQYQDGVELPSWTNDYITLPTGNPNATVALAMWVSEEVSEAMHFYAEDMEDEG